MNKPLFFTTLVLSLAIDAWSQETRLEVAPSGRLLIDAGTFRTDNTAFKSGFTVVDARAGLEAEYGPYTAEIEVGYSYGKLSLKDLFICRSFGKHSRLQIGYFRHHYGLQSTTGSAEKISMEEPSSHEAFFESRMPGLMFAHSNGKFFGTASFHVEKEAIKKTVNELGRQGYGLMSRLLYRPFRSEGRIFHAGLSGGCETPRYNEDASLNHSSFVLSTHFPTRIVDATAQEATVTAAKRLYKFSPEVCAAYGRIGFESQYFYQQVKRENGQADFRSSGVYALLRGAIIGRDYSYSERQSAINQPGGGTLECVLGYNYTNLNDSKAGIRGGIMNDASLTFNYYINKYIIWRLRCSYTSVTGRTDRENESVGAIQTRLQIKF